MGRLQVAFGAEKNFEQKHAKTAKVKMISAGGGEENSSLCAL